MMTLRSRIGEARQQFLRFIYSRPVDLGDQGPVVSFCFDDFPRSAYIAGGSILKSYGARGTYYAAPGLINTHNELGEQLRRDDIDSLLADGHELGCHTFSHISCRRVSQSKFESDVERGRDAIRAITGSNSDNFAYPYGHLNARLKKTLGMKMRSCRGIYGGINAPVVDLNLLKANSLYGDVSYLSKVRELLAANQNRKGWLVFYTHDVCQRPSPYGCTPELLEESVYLVTQNGLKIASVKEVLDGIQNVGGYIPKPAGSLDQEIQSRRK